MTVQGEIRAVVKAVHANAIRDSCHGATLGHTNSRQANRRAWRLALTDSFKRRPAHCGRCQGNSKVFERIT